MSVIDRSDPPHNAQIVTPDSNVRLPRSAQLRRLGCYPVLWNALAKLARDFSDADNDWLFHDTAGKAYRT